jgi:hypothetical protein
VERLNGRRTNVAAVVVVVVVVVLSGMSVLTSWGKFISVSGTTKPTLGMHKK